jgi:hypothetical protein
MNVHPIPPKVLVARHNQLLRFESNGQPLERSQGAQGSWPPRTGLGPWCGDLDFEIWDRLEEET